MEKNRWFIFDFQYIYQWQCFVRSNFRKFWKFIIISLFFVSFLSLFSDLPLLLSTSFYSIFVLAYHLFLLVSFSSEASITSINLSFIMKSVYFEFNCPFHGFVCLLQSTFARQYHILSIFFILRYNYQHFRS